jgi:DUF1365 family protein
MVTLEPAVRAGLYVGWLRHRRRHPVAHAFRYPIFMVLLDVDDIPGQMAVSRLTSYNRWNWASFHDSDHLGDPSRPLRARLERLAEARGRRLPDGRIFLLTHLRYLGYCFNPVSFYYCYDAAGRLETVLAEVHNTFGGAHTYWLEPDGRPGFRAEATKRLYVSPFMPQGMRYRFALSEPADRLVAHIDAATPTGADPHAMDATLSLEFRPWTAREVRRLLIRYPAMTIAVTARIHWQALSLWRRGLRVMPRPSANGEEHAPGSSAAIRSFH